MKDLAAIVKADFNGVISVSQGGEPLFKKAYGYADLPNKRPNTIDTKFGTASAGKAFVAVAIFKLIEEGRLSLGSEIGSLVNFDLKAISGKITVVQLLGHTSGIPDYFDESVMVDYAELWADVPNYRIRSSADLVPLFIDKPMVYKPGERFQYNNTGYVVLGLIIEKITGMGFDAFLKETIFSPCGMRDTGYYELDRLPENCASAYILDEKRNEYYTNIYSIDAKGTGAGGAFTTAGDVEKFWTHLKDGEIISKTAVSEMLSPKAENGQYGYGFWIMQGDAAPPLPYFQGSDPGVNFISSCDRGGLLITAISNFGDNVWHIHRELRKLLAGKK